ncbi:ribonuclease P protein component [Blattabacterium cuenoti]|uniref:ribonuclease P protein component n=1 Tax=Blattabacterium cuenoti TaxID=1653831 RepID=UPI00163CEB6E|nr:ribonuclease P protein component [Blattabacterium cuenoti]
MKIFSLKKNVGDILEYGNFLSVFPIKIAYFLEKRKKKTTLIKLIGILVKKKIFKKSVHRNKIKRLFRASLLFNKYILEQKINFNKIYIVFIYKGLFLPTFKIIDTSIKKILNQIH